MAIRIIDPGPHKSVVKEVICQNCGATLEYTPGDVKNSVSRDYDMGVEVTKYIVCPKCTKDVTVQRY